ncbi:murein hydrolase activator EnvC family protein [Oryzobacter terrae]|uniref:murein hydrolase activator EnvC family protein n=1 Tax=Oryzobacter terrae TaxID=1620385 RepID=UPI003670F1BD
MSRSLVASLAALAAVGALALAVGPPTGEPFAAARVPIVATAPDRPDRRDGAPSSVAGMRTRAAVGSAPRASGLPRSTPRWRWPLVPRPPVLRRFRAPPSPWASGHRGMDLAARSGDAVLAVAAGTVTHRGIVAGRGTVTVLHAGGLRSTYEPVDPAVSVGDLVVPGDVVGSVRPGGGTSASHCGPRVCLHLGARRDDGYVDPWPLLVRGRLVLLPLR